MERREAEAQFAREVLGGKAVLEEVEPGRGITVIIGNNEEELTLWVDAFVRSADVATSTTTTDPGVALPQNGESANASSTVVGDTSSSSLEAIEGHSTTIISNASSTNETP